MDIFDIAIVGGGPAGSMLAMKLNGSLNVAMIDLKGDADGFRKPCGGLLSPDAQNVLRKSGLTLPEDVLVSPQLFSVRTLDVQSGIVRRYGRKYVNIDRHAFDMWLRGLAEEKCTLFENSRVVSVKRRDGGVFEVSFLRGGQEHVLRARCVIGADGANSAVRRAVGKPLNTREYVSLQQYFRACTEDSFYSCIFDCKATDCYSWGLHKDGVYIFGGAYPKKDCRALFERQKEVLSAHGFTFGDPLRTDACIVLRPKGFSSFDIGEDGVFYVGEAAGFISPSSLEGISSAMITGSSLADVFNDVKCLDFTKIRYPYALKTLSLKLRLTAKLLKCPFMYWPALRRMVMASGIAAIE